MVEEVTTDPSDCKQTTLVAIQMLKQVMPPMGNRSGRTRMNRAGRVSIVNHADEWRGAVWSHHRVDRQTRTPGLVSHIETGQERSAYGAEREPDPGREVALALE